LIESLCESFYVLHLFNDNAKHMKTIESNDGTVYEIAVQGHEIHLMAYAHTLVIKIIGDFDSENVEKYIDANFDRAVRINDFE